MLHPPRSKVRSTRRSQSESTSQQLTTWLGSGFDPDDPIGFGVNGFVAVDDTLGATVESWIKSQVPADLGTFGQLKTRSFAQTFASDVATYQDFWDLTI